MYVAYIYSDMYLLLCVYSPSLTNPTILEFSCAWKEREYPRESKLEQPNDVIYNNKLYICMHVCVYLLSLCNKLIEFWNIKSFSISVGS